jgi:hypothetical protein
MNEKFWKGRDDHMRATRSLPHPTRTMGSTECDFVFLFQRQCRLRSRPACPALAQHTHEIWGCFFRGYASGVPGPFTAGLSSATNLDPIPVRLLSADSLIGLPALRVGRPALLAAWHAALVQSACWIHSGTDRANTKEGVRSGVAEEYVPHSCPAPAPPSY